MDVRRKKSGYKRRVKREREREKKVQEVCKTSCKTCRNRKKKKPSREGEKKENPRKKVHGRQWAIASKGVNNRRQYTGIARFQSLVCSDK